MKRKITGILIIFTLILSVGCSSKDTNEVSDAGNTSQVVSNNSEEKIYEIHEELLPKVRAVFEEYGLELEEYPQIDNKYYTGIEGISFETFDDTNHGDIGLARYKVAMSEGKAINVYADLFLDVEPDKIKENGFKIEDSIFAAVDKVMGNEDVDYTEINEEIKEAYNTGGNLYTTREYGNISCSVTADGDLLSYTITVNPES